MDYKSYINEKVAWIMIHYLQLQLNSLVERENVDGRVGKENDDTDDDGEKFMALEMRRGDSQDPSRRTYSRAANCMARWWAPSGSP